MYISLIIILILFLWQQLQKLESRVTRDCTRQNVPILVNNPPQNLSPQMKLRKAFVAERIYEIAVFEKI